MRAAAGDALSVRLEEVLSLVDVRPDGLTATVGERTVTADSPRALAVQLATTLYEVVHVGRTAAEPVTAKRRWDARDLEAGLARGVPHEHTRYRGPVLSGGGGERLVVGLSGVRVRVARERVVGDTGTANGEEAEVLIAAARPLLSPGFFLVDGSRPLAHQGAVLRLYLHVESPEVLLDAWGRTLRCLEERGVAYRAKAISSADALPRRDGIVVYLGSEDQHVLAPLAAEMEENAGLGAGTSPFARSLAPGVAVAWEPDDSRPGMRNTSFGEHRSRALATGLVRHATAPDGSRDRSEWVREAFLEAGIDPLEPARNLSSPPFDTGF
ncbi:T3SS effector HopA1 family protein [Streptomyces sp. S.PNR 29]|uniref:T3SS effector HopA1 family protein n=1 Tax=Streptomyces sp. S.PNR 29 TaxID=2973805 RepID=UPI0025B20EE4|nr:T3SS effector HopA1 family protein [Streptomyces sp. S.PNR 29]MDN0193999.1 T3SS effector HopA1 family protein [Streptomyces sp. S.PNR 29]